MRGRTERNINVGKSREENKNQCYSFMSPALTLLFKCHIAFKKHPPTA